MTTPAIAQLACLRCCADNRQGGHATVETLNEQTGSREKKVRPGGLRLRVVRTRRWCFSTYATILYHTGHNSPFGNLAFPHDSAQSASSHVSNDAWTEEKRLDRARCLEGRTLTPRLRVPAGNRKQRADRFSYRAMATVQDTRYG